MAPTDLPGGLFGEFAVQSSLQKYFASPFGRNSFIDSPSRPIRGAYASSRTLVRDAVDAAATQDERRFCGRRSRVVLTPRRWCQVCERQLSQATVARKPGRRGEREISRKTIARGMPGVFRCDRCEYSCASITTMRTRGCGRIGRPAFPAPSVFWAHDLCTTRARRAAGSRSCVACPGCCAAPPARSRASSTRYALRCGALLIRGPYDELGMIVMGPGSAAQREGRCTASGKTRKVNPADYLLALRFPVFLV